MLGGNPTARPPLAGTARFVRALVACALAAALPVPAYAAGDTHTMQGSSAAEVLAPGQIIKIRDMNFGQIAAATAAGTVVLNPATSLCTSTLVLAGACQSAVFDGLAPGGQVVRLAVSNSITLNGSNGGTMTLNNFTLDTAPELVLQGGNGNGNGNGNRRYTPAASSGFFAFRVGGTLNVGANQTPGAYTGTFTVTARFQ
jgi:Domain of unknown function (DUF4402)